MKPILLSALAFLLSIILHAQTVGTGSIGIGTSTPQPSAVLDVQSNNKGMLIPRMSTAQRNAIVSPALGLLVFDTDKSGVMFFDGANWRQLSFTEDNTNIPVARSAAGVQQGSSFGYAVAVSGNYAIIGSPGTDLAGATNAGIVYIFAKTNNNWLQAVRISASDSAASDGFGTAVAISGDYAVVGAPGKKIGSNAAQGKIYIYHRNGAAWLLESSFYQTTGAAALNYFGNSVAVTAFATSGPTVIAAAGAHDINTGVQEVELYQRTTAGSWNLQQKINPADLGARDGFGQSVAIDSNYFIVGAPYKTNNSISSGANAGAAYIYTLARGGFWEQQKEVFGAAAAYKLGNTVAIWSTFAAASVPGATGVNNAPFINMYTRTGTAWSTGQAVSQPSTYGATQRRGFGNSISINQGDLIVGASGGFSTGMSLSEIPPGAAYLYKSFDGNVSYQLIKTIASGFDNSANIFANTVSVSNGTYIISDYQAISNGIPNSGQVLFGSTTP